MNELLGPDLAGALMLDDVICVAAEMPVAAQIVRIPIIVPPAHSDKFRAVDLQLSGQRLKPIGFPHQLCAFHFVCSIRVIKHSDWQLMKGIPEIALEAFKCLSGFAHVRVAMMMTEGPNAGVKPPHGGVATACSVA